jgi:ComF family protein
MFVDLVRTLSAATPAQCEVCRAWPAQPLCQGCRLRFATLRHRCIACAIALPDGPGRCGRCVQEPPPLDECHAVVSYGYPWAGLVAGFKFSGQPGWAGTFAPMMGAHAGIRACADAADLVVPMPLSRERLAARGFNQSWELARRLAPRKAHADLLLRVRDTPPQVGLERPRRLSNVQGAFALEPARAHEVRGRAVLLVDDVMTSGASLFSAAQALRAAGAARVWAAVFARTED